MKSAFFLLLGTALLSSCAITQSSSCRKAAQGDIPCQGLNGLDFQKCQLEVRRAVATCQAEQMHKSPDSVGVYRLPPPDPTPAKAVAAPPVAPVVPVAVPEPKDTITPAPVLAERVLVDTPSAPVVDSVARAEPSPVNIDSSVSGTKDSTVIAAPTVDDTLAKSIEASPTPVAAMADSATTPLDSTAPLVDSTLKSDSASSSLAPEAPVGTEPAMEEAPPADTAKAIIATAPSEAILNDSTSATEPVKKKKKRSKKKSSVASAP